MFDQESEMEGNGEILFKNEKVGDVYYRIKETINKGALGIECNIHIAKPTAEQIALLNSMPSGLVLKSSNGKTFQAKVAFIILPRGNYDLLLTQS